MATQNADYLRNHDNLRYLQMSSKTEALPLIQKKNQTRVTFNNDAYSASLENYSVEQCSSENEEVIVYAEKDNEQERERQSKKQRKNYKQNTKDIIAIPNSILYILN